MSKRSRFCKMLGVTLLIASICSMTAFADESEAYQQKVENAKEYLSDYSEEKVNKFGEKYTVEYVFKTNEDLQGASSYIAEYGLDKFNEELEKSIMKSVEGEKSSGRPETRTTDPSTAYETVSGDGSHRVSTSAYGLASFDTLGTVEYQLELGYKVDVSNGKMTGISSVNFDVLTISSSGSWGDISLPSYCNDTSAGVTANYTITKTVEVALGDFSFEMRLPQSHWL